MIGMVSLISSMN